MFCICIFTKLFHHVKSAGFELVSVKSKSVCKDVVHQSYFFLCCVSVHGSKYDFVIRFDGPCRVVEKHHRLKLDAPSGTALALADSINEAMDNQYHYTYDRSQRREMRDDKEIGISAVRGGTIVGEHEVIFAGPDEVIEFKHTAYSKAVFGKGAIEAAKFLAGKPAGRYDMSDVISAK